jgi:hypothetical protein
MYEAEPLAEKNRKYPYERIQRPLLGDYLNAVKRPDIKE